MSDLQVKHKRVYKVNDKGEISWVLIIFDISSFHYIGLNVMKECTDTSIYLNSIQKYVELSVIRDYKSSMIIDGVYISGMPLEITNQELYLLFKKCKKTLISYLNNNVKADVDGITYLKWEKDKYILNASDNQAFLSTKQNAIYWVNMGYGVGSEIRKIRPAIVWRVTKDKKMATLIPLTTKNYDDKSYFHYDLSEMKNCTAKVEYLSNYSTKRIIAPYFKNDTLVFINKKEIEDLKKIIKKYYTFEFDN